MELSWNYYGVIRELLGNSGSTRQFKACGKRITGGAAAWDGGVIPGQAKRCLSGEAGIGRLRGGVKFGGDSSPRGARKCERGSFGEASRPDLPECESLTLPFGRGRKGWFRA